MIDLINPGNFEFFARYFLAGFILFSVRSLYVLGEKPKASEVVFESVILSLINQLAFLLISTLLTYALSVLPLAITGAVTAAGSSKPAFFAEVLVLPALLGVGVGMVLRKGWNSAVVTMLAMPVVHPTRRAYDYAFGDIQKDRFVIVSFNDGTQVFGYFGENSFAATDSDRSDMFLERLYVVTDGNWVPTMPAKSALLMLRDIRSIEFIPVQTEVPNET